MKLKNAVVFRLEPDSFKLSAEELEAHLQELKKKPLGPQEMSRPGFSSPLGRHGEMLVHSANGCHLMCISKEDRIIPSSVVNEELEERVDTIEQEQSRKVGRKERNEMKDQIILELMPKSFTKTSHTYGYVDTQNNLLVVDAGSAKKAEDFASFLRQAIGSLKARPMMVDSSPSFVMTGWLTEERVVPDSFQLGASANLKDTGEDPGKINLKNLELVSEEIQNHLAQGMVVTQLQVHFDDKMAFNLNEEMQIKSIKYGEILNEQLDAIDADDRLAVFDASFTITSGFIALAVDAIANAFDGDVTFR